MKPLTKNLIWVLALFLSQNLLAQITVENTDDAGPGSLRQAIIDANASGSQETIDFNIPGVGPWVISLTSEDLPDITNANGMIIDGTTQPGWVFEDENAMVTIDADAVGLGYIFNVQASNVEIYGLVMINAPSYGILTNFGVDGVQIGASGKGNVISANGNGGILISASDGVTIQGNYIGTSVDGLSANGNLDNYGINVVAFGTVTIGGDRTAGEGNIISANGGGFGDYGVRIEMGTVNVFGNYIGTDATGDVALGNYNNGVYIQGGTAVNIGGSGTGQGNVISGNGHNVTDHGITVTGGSNIKIRNNLIGLDASGMDALPNTGRGIDIQTTVIGLEITDNTISASTDRGILFTSFSGQGALITGNKIGTDVNGDYGAGLGNATTGIDLSNASGVSLGDPIYLANNVISGNGTSGFGHGISEFNAQYIVIESNLIGVESDGVTANGNDDSGINLTTGTNIQIGGVGVENVLAHNGAAGVITTGTGFGSTQDVRVNSYFCNGNLGINIPNIFPDVEPPAIISVAGGVVSGSSTAPETSVVDVYDTDPTCSGEQGAAYLGSTTVQGDGSWSLTTSYGNTSVVATVTDATNGISEFSTASEVTDAPFITTWQTDADDTQLTIPAFDGPTYDYNVYWENVSNSSDNGSLSSQSGSATMTGLTSSSTYRVEISGDFPAIYFNNTGDREKILTVEQWGDNVWEYMNHSFYGCTNLTVPATDAPDLSGLVAATKSLQYMFTDAASLNEPMDHWDVSNIQDFFGMFWGATSFNQPLNNWDVSSATSFSHMFNGAAAFNQPLDNWNPTGLTGFNGIRLMFTNATSFNQPVNHFDVDQVTDFAGTFEGATAFNQPLDNWDVGLGTSFGNMFFGAVAFDQSLATWDISSAGASAWQWSLFNSGLSTANYDQTLIGWATLDVGESQIPSSLTVNANLNYCDSVPGRDVLINSYSWVFGSDSPDCSEAVFVTTWETTSANETITIGTGTGTYDYSIDWGDGTVESLTSADPSHTYLSAGTYTVEILGDFPHLSMADISATPLNLQTVEQWGNIAWESFTGAFQGCTNLQVNATDAPDLSVVTEMESMFAQCANFNSAIDHWDVSNIQNMRRLFFGATNFDQSLSTWEVDNVSDFSEMFRNASMFDQDISGWNVAGATTMEGMFENAIAFNQPLDDWGAHFTSVSSVASMFYGASAFDQDLSSWSFPGVATFSNMFRDATSFNGDVTNMVTSNANILNGMFWGATSFNGDISSWNTSGATFFDNLFLAASAFDQGLGSLDIGSATNMTNMLSNSGLSVENYDQTLIDWAAQDRDFPVSLGASSLFYCSGGAAQDYMTTNYGWSFSDEGKVCPDDPSNLFATEVATSQIDLSWTDNSSDETNFAIFRSSGNNSAFIEINTVAADVTTYSDNTVTADNNYFYYVVARNSGGDSAPSNEKAAATFAPAGNTLVFDGTDDHINLGDILDNTFSGVDKTFTLEAWISISSMDGNHIVRKSGTSTCGSDERQFGFSVNASGNLSFDYYGSLALVEQRTVVGTTVLNTNQWYHVATTYDGSIDTNDGLDRVKFYVNGIEESTSLLTSTGSFPFDIPDGPAHLGIGSQLNSSGTLCALAGQIFEGEMDEVRIWNTARSAAEIQSTSMTELMGNESGLVAYYKFDQTDAAITVLPDRSANTNDGTLTNFEGAASWVPSGAFTDPYEGVVVSTGDSGIGSLRSAIDYANANATTTISFNIPDPSPWTINLLSELPQITEDGTIIDGTTQPGWDIDLGEMVTLDGSALSGNDDGIRINAANVEIYGLQVSSFPRYGITTTPVSSAAAIIGAVGKGNVVNNNGNTGIAMGWTQSFVVGNRIGTDPSGTVAAPNYTQGVSLANNTTVTDNLISGHNSVPSSRGIFSNAVGGHTISNNLVGTDITGTYAIPNSRGIVIVTGGNSTVDSNLISGNTTAGIWSNTGFNNNDITNNIIGMDSTVTSAIPNGIGILYSGGVGNRLGYKDNPNIIAGNTGAAIETIGATSSENTWATNEIYGNGSGIVLVAGANGDIAVPTLDPLTETSASGAGPEGATIHLYRADVNGQGETFLDSAVVSGGIWSISGLTLLDGDELVATSTDYGTGLGTSAFSTAEVLVLPNAPSGLTATEISTSQIDLTWMDNSSDETGFAIFRSAGNNSSYTEVGTVGADVTTYSDSSVPAENNYYYHVVARNAAGDSGPSEEKVAATFTQPGNALDFDGAGDVVVVPEDPSLDFGDDDFTLEFWISTTGTSGRILNKHECGTGNGWIVSLESSGTVQFYVNVATISSTTAINDGRWHHVAVSFASSTNEQSIYIDGELEASQFGNNGNANNADIGIMAWADEACGGAGGDGAIGLLDEVRIWGDVRSVTEIRDNMLIDLVGNESDLLAYYKFDQTDPAMAVLPDRSINEIDGTLTNFGGAASWTASGAMQLEKPVVYNATDVSTNGFSANFSVPDDATDIILDVDDDADFSSLLATGISVGTSGTFNVSLSLTEGTTYYYRVRADHGFAQSENAESNGFKTSPGNALSFDGVDDYVSIPSSSSLQIPSTVTLSAWVKRTRLDGTDIILEKGGDWNVGNPNYGMALHPSNNHMFYFYYDGGWLGTSGVDDLEWHHYAVVAQNGDTDLDLYIDGELRPVEYSGGSGTINLTTSGHPLIIGAQVTSLAYYGADIIDEVRIWNTLRSQAEIQADMYSTLTGNEDNLVAYYQFDEGVANGTNTGVTTLPGLTGNANDGILNNMALSGTSSNWVGSGYLIGGVVAWDYDALVALYNATDGANWTDNTGWLTGNVEDWFGVIVTDNRVTQINLDGNNLVGTIPTEIGGLTGLNYLYIGDNALTGSLPAELGDLVNLIEIDGANCQLSGSIPDELQSLVNLTEFDFDDNQLSGSIPTWIDSWVSMSWLDLQDNMLTGTIPVEIGSLPNIGTLKIGGNQLTGTIPTEIGNLTTLDGNLDLSDNQLTGSIPITLGNLVNLNELNLHTNQLSGSIPAEMGSLANLEYLYLDVNQLTGSIPVELGDISRLVELYLDENQLTGSIPIELTTLIDLQDFRLNDNQLSGTIPSEIGALTSLHTLRLNVNELTGSLPTEIGDLTNLLNMELNDNQLSGSLPTTIGNLALMENLELQGNQFSGTIPEELGDLTNLNTLKLNANDFTGSVPTAFSNLVNLENLKIEENGLSDLPDLTTLALLTQFEVRDNNFEFDDIEPNVGITGIVYSPQADLIGSGDFNINIGDDLDVTIAVGGSNNLYQWYKDGSPISGQTTNNLLITDVDEGIVGTYHLEVTNSVATGLTISSESFDVTLGMTGGVLTTDYNALVDLYNATDGANWTDNTGWLSGNVEDWFGITVVDDRVTGIRLNSNNLIGTLTSSLGDLTDLVHLDMEINQLSGSLPSEIGNLIQLDYIDFEENQLSGSIPAELGNLVNTTELDLMENQFSGPIPAELGDMASLEILELNDNQLTGTIPEELGDLSNLQYLSLEINQLSGSIPTSLGNLSNLAFIDMEDNQLTGSIPAELGNLTLLTELDLMNNQLSGSIPAEFGVLVNLEVLELNENDLSGEIPVELGNLTSLQYLNVEQNQLTGSIPAELGNLTNLIHLYLNDNALSGTVPSELGNLALLEELLVSRNNLSGEFPELGLTNLIWASLAHNNFSGSVPEFFSNNVNMVGIGLANNNFSGSVPTSYALLTSLDRLNISGNELDALPDLSGITTLTFFNASNNDFEFDDIEPNVGITGITYSPQADLTSPGGVTLEVGEELNVSFTVGGANNTYVWEKDGFALAGQNADNLVVNNVVPSDAGVYRLAITNSVATDLVLYSEEITVTVNTIGGVSTNDYNALVDFYNATDGDNWTDNTNWLSTEPVNSWHGITSVYDGRVRELVLVENNLSGGIPAVVGNLDALRRLNLSDNDLTGTIPAEVWTLTNLEQLWLVGNQLTGSIPSEIGNLVLMEKLHLGWNMFDGDIPDELWNLINLNELAIGRNNLTGSISPSVGNLTDLVQLHLYENNFAGTLPSELQNLSLLEDLLVYDNSFNDLPDFSGLGNISILGAANNTFEFDDIEPNIGIATFGYSPQADIAGPGDMVLNEGDLLDITLPVGGSNNVYQWVKDGLDLSGQTTDNLLINSVTAADAGTYHLRITNSVATDLTLVSDSFVVTVNVTATSPEITAYIGNDNSGIELTSGQVEVVDFGSSSQGMDLTQTFTIENTGTSDLTISSIISTDLSFSVIDAPSVVSPGASENFGVTLSGNMVGAYNTTITISSNDSDESSFSFPVSGEITSLNIVVSGSSTSDFICLGDDITLTGSGALTYEWDNGVIDGEAFVPVETTTYTVTGTDQFGNTGTDQVTVVVNPLPVVTAAVTATSICLGDEVVFTGAGASSYRWDNSIEDGVAFTPLGSGVFKVIGTDANGCRSEATVEVSVQVVDLPIITIEDVNGRQIVLTSSEADSYQWYEDGEPLAAETNRTLEVERNYFFETEYQVEVTEGECSNISEPTGVTILGTDELSDPTLEFWPNPATDVMYLKVPVELRNGEVRIFDLTGSMVLARQIGQNETSELDITSLGNGVYFLSFDGSGEVIRFIKK